MLADELFGLLRSSLPGDAPGRIAPPRESPVADKGKRPVVEVAPSGTLSPGEEIDSAPATGPSSGVSALITSGVDPAEAPRSSSAGSGPARDPLEDFEVPPAGTSFGAGSYVPSGGFPWMPELGPMLDEIWSEESFRQLSEEPLQAGNREGMRLLAKVNSADSYLRFRFDLLLISDCCRHFWQTSPTPEGRKPSSLKARKLCSIFEERRKSSPLGFKKFLLKRTSLLK